MKKLIAILFLLLAMTALGQVTTASLTRQFLTNYTEFLALGRLGPETNITQLLKSNQLSGMGTLLGPVTSWIEEQIIRPNSSNITDNSHLDYGAPSFMYYHSTNLLKAGWYKIYFLKLRDNINTEVQFFCNGSLIAPNPPLTPLTQWVSKVFFAATNNSYITAQINIGSGLHAGFTNLTIQPVIFCRSNVVDQENEYAVGNFDSIYASNLVVLGHSSVINNHYNLISYGNSTNYNANFGFSEQRLNVITNIYFVNSSNKMDANIRNLSIIFDNHSGSNRALFFNTSWKWLGTTYNPPTIITNGKVGVLALKAWGSDETNVIAAFAVQP